jgi:hypothetical protein
MPTSNGTASTSDKKSTSMWFVSRNGQSSHGMCMNTQAGDKSETAFSSNLFMDNHGCYCTAMAREVPLGTREQQQPTACSATLLKKAPRMEYSRNIHFSK